MNQQTKMFQELIDTLKEQNIVFGPFEWSEELGFHWRSLSSPKLSDVQRDALRGDQWQKNRICGMKLTYDWTVLIIFDENKYSPVDLGLMVDQTTIQFQIREQMQALANTQEKIQMMKKLLPKEDISNYSVGVG